MRFIRKFKTLLIRDKRNNDKEKITKINKKDKPIQNSINKSLNNSNITNYTENKNRFFCYESFGKLKVYRRAIIKNEVERKQLLNQISKELEKLS